MMSQSGIADTEAATNPERAGFIFKADWVDPIVDAAFSITFADAGQWDVFMDYPREFPRWNGCDALRPLCFTQGWSQLIDHIDAATVRWLTRDPGNALQRYEVIYCQPSPDVLVGASVRLRQH